MYDPVSRLQVLQASACHNSDMQHNDAGVELKVARPWFIQSS
jgi:hypothetical protein